MRISAPDFGPVKSGGSVEIVWTARARHVHQEVAPRRMHAQVRGVRAVRRLRVEKRQPAHRVDGERADAPGASFERRFVLIHAVEVRRIEREVRRVVGRHDLHELEVPIGRAHLEDVDAARGAGPAPLGRDGGRGVRTDVDEALLRVVAGGSRCVSPRRGAPGDARGDRDEPCDPQDEARHGRASLPEG